MGLEILSEKEHFSARFFGLGIKIPGNVSHPEIRGHREAMKSLADRFFGKAHLHSNPLPLYVFDCQETKRYLDVLQGWNRAEKRDAIREVKEWNEASLGGVTQGGLLIVKREIWKPLVRILTSICDKEGKFYIEGGRLKAKVECALYGIEEEHFEAPTDPRFRIPWSNFLELENPGYLKLDATTTYRLRD